MTAIKPLQNNKRITSSCLNNHKITKSTSSTRRHCVSRMKRLTSGDIELNPGPEQNLRDVRANCFCASLLRTTASANPHATSCIERACQVLKWTRIGQMAIAIALLGFNDLGRSVTPTFLFRNRLYIQLSPHCSKMNKKSMWEDKKISRFLSTGHGILPSCGCKARETVVSKCELILWGPSPVD